tara:strand:+ start:10946 stop:11770 length:825 start_codon:yes stop_codon:yes gene_type:complete
MYNKANNNNLEHSSIIGEQSIAICVVGNFRYLFKHLNTFINQVRNEGCYSGPILILTSRLTLKSLIPLDDRSNLTFFTFKKIKFSKLAEKSLKTLDTGDQPNRHVTKNFQWHKLHLFDEKLKKWKYIFYIDINMKIHSDINPILDLKEKNILFANEDSNDENNWKLSGQFDATHPQYLELKKNFNLNVTNYFQTGILFFDTEIIKNNTKNDLIDLVEKYPISKTNEQGIMNLYFYSIKNTYKTLPRTVNKNITYNYWETEETSIITKQSMKNKR